MRYSTPPFKDVDMWMQLRHTTWQMIVLFKESFIKKETHFCLLCRNVYSVLPSAHADKTTSERMKKHLTWLPQKDLEKIPRKHKTTMLENCWDPLHWLGITLTPQPGLWVVPLTLVKIFGYFSRIEIVVFSGRKHEEIGPNSCIVVSEIIFHQLDAEHPERHKGDACAAFKDSSGYNSLLIAINRSKTLASNKMTSMKTPFNPTKSLSKIIIGEKTCMTPKTKSPFWSG